MTRIVATDTKKGAAKNKPAATTKKTTPKKSAKPAGEEKGGLIGYFKGAWYELKQVQWPTRKATWGMTAAMLAYTAFFVVLILLLDALFKYLFELMLG